ncbi:hypothetical protein CANCADRAFT_2681 [Tortispora caseinolytica NRRL Y-17796]|uniref:Nucleotide exchange factor SIL1 n=1 Tax=Tortispora caseinolytica NRRL Y-17796 TaxID=767744 RepID=A0A1E4TGR5_9ASCO|nr:hypothetical protein CANCADRAFT_2681 [Tortispora caseinolytica NRRL Y-17796]
MEWWLIWAIAAFSQVLDIYRGDLRALDEYTAIDTALSIISSNIVDTDPQLHHALDVLEELNHDYTYAIHSVNSEMLPILSSKMATTKDPQIKALMAMNIASCLRNNQQTLQHSKSMVVPILNLIKTEPSYEVKMRLISALSATLQHPKSLDVFKLKNLGTVENVCFTNSVPELVGKCASLFQDIASDMDASKREQWKCKLSSFLTDHEHQCSHATIQRIHDCIAVL